MQAGKGQNQARSLTQSNKSKMVGEKYEGPKSRKQGGNTRNAGREVYTELAQTEGSTQNERKKGETNQGGADNQGDRKDRNYKA